MDRMKSHVKTMFGNNEEDVYSMPNKTSSNVHSLY